MEEVILSVETQIATGRDFRTPPLHLWHPSLSGDIPIRICPQGFWYHEGVKIERPALVRLFASILRREDDGDYYLVTPAEKWRIQVDLHALLLVDFNWKEGEQELEATTNTGLLFPVNEHYPLFLDHTIGGVAAMQLPHGLTALCTRAAWYRLIDLADPCDGSTTLRSGNYEFSLSNNQD